MARVSSRRLLIVGLLLGILSLDAIAGERPERPFLGGRIKRFITRAFDLLGIPPG
ncbi:MAG: hypothetical protein JOZ54_12635 [Acidobacteria bacterium]|nr:hypothetical protein [Acidobacteriota bacterium]